MSTAQSSARTPILPRADAASLGFSTERLGRIRSSMEREVSAGLLPGGVLAVARRGRLAYLEAFGQRDAATGAPMWADAVFSIASMTKPMTSAAILMLHEEGRLLLGDPVSKHLPALAGMRVAKADGSGETVPADREMTVQDLLRHTSGLTYRDRGTTPAHKLYPGSSIVATVRHTREEFLALLQKAPLIYQPGTVWEYGFSTDILGLVVEAVSGQSLGQFLAERLWRPLGMVDTSFTLSDAQRSRYARAFPKCPITGDPLTVHHATAEIPKWESGGGGAVSTAADYIRFAQMLLDGGTLGGQRILGRKTVELMTADHLTPSIVNRITTMDAACDGYGFGLGFAVRRGAGGAALMGSAGDYYWSGVYGTYFWIDPAEQLAAVFMAAAPGMIRLRYRQLMRGLVLQAIEA
ncbi:MAG TPA: serine hydrolase domain-containing protein [Hyphomicrobiaceae bacterium]|nr:serine hydrolase domain-containing protein [Hyphomicrobiaceae bacterium]